MPELSILIPARNEMFLSNTVENILENIEGDTEIIVVADGLWPDPPIKDNPRVKMIYHSKSIGQRAATNEAAKLSRAKFIMKVDAHCAFDKGFDIKLMADCQYTDTMIPRMYNLHAFDWVCKCGHRQYQGPTPEKCGKCGDKMERQMMWERRPHTSNDFMTFDKDLHFQYWHSYKDRIDKKEEIVETMSLLGACWFMHRQRYWDIDGCDESHGSWGQMGTEIACKTWLSGGRLLTNRKTWFAHMFRTQGGDFGFPYPNPGVKAARKRSQELWIKNQWPKAIHPLSWLIEKFAPVPTWEVKVTDKPVGPSKGIVYYTDNRLDESILKGCQKVLKRCVNGNRIVSVSLKPLDFGENIVMDMERGYLAMFKQILKGIEASTADIIFLCEHDILYHPSHFEFTPPRKDVYYYDQNRWTVRTADGQAAFCSGQTVSGLCAYRELLLQHYQKKVERVEKEGFTRRLGFEPGNHPYPRGIDFNTFEDYWSEHPYVDIRHGGNITWFRYRIDQYRRKPKEFKLADEIPFWGKTKGRFQEFLADAVQTP